MRFLKANIGRGISLSKLLVDQFKLDLSSLKVITECASNGYAFTAVMARLAGADVYAVGKDSRFGSFKDNFGILNHIFRELGVMDCYEAGYNEIPQKIWKQADIVLNNGFVRPITEQKIKLLKTTAVIPLMWETWEFRKDEIDIVACQKHGIPIIGTNESFQSIKMFSYNGMIALNLLFRMGIEVHNNKIILLGGHKTGTTIAQTFDKLELDYDWFTPEGTEKVYRCYSYDDLPRLINIKSIDAIICAEHFDNRCLIGRECNLDFSQLKAKHPCLRWGHISGNIDERSLYESGLLYYPKEIMPVGYMSYQASNLGIRPVLELNAAGLKVGEIAARARLGGATIEEAIGKTIAYGVGMDFDGGFNNYGR